ncbi:MAG: FKBP-type peptidyl-prolyl cis-trans isomerase [Gemmatimonadaceae bacterium]|nr:FKBP-type peptidyl-prolyl cis-trans isomerase [Gemmatimonadaceae bacterium]
MPPALVRSRRVAAAVALATSTLSFAGCSLGGDSTLPPFTDPATQTYAPITGVTIASMNRVNAQVYTQDVTVGTGRTVAKGDSISVYYVGRLTGGFEFDARARPSTPFSSVLDTVHLIKGWVNGLEGMKVGGTRRMAVGPESAYQYSTVRDQAGNIVIPANSVLVFDVEVTEALARP